MSIRCPHEDMKTSVCVKESESADIFTASCFLCFGVFFFKAGMFLYMCESMCVHV